MIRREGGIRCSKRFVGNALAFFAGLFILSQAAFAQSSLVLTPEAVLDYGTHCFESGDYDAAASCYRQFLYFFPNDERSLLADYQIGLCEFHEKCYDRALQRFTRIFEEHGFTGVGTKSAFMISRCYRKLGDVQSAIRHLSHLEQLAKDPVLLDPIHHELGWLYLESGRFNKARDQFSRILLPENRLRYQSARIFESLAEEKPIPRKSPVAAGLLSLVPGGGYLYCGRYRDALVAFLVTGAFGIGAAECFAEDLESVGGIMTVLGVGFYGGSIYGGIASAHKFNRAAEIECVETLKRKFSPELGILMKNRGPGVLLSWRF